MASDVICLGELFIDLVPHSKVKGQWLYAPSPGGAPGNVAVGLARLGRKALMISRVGDEAFGRLLVSALAGYGVDTSGVVLSKHEKTGLSVVTLAENGDRAFMFYHDHPADLHIDPEDILPAIIERCRILHVGVLPLSAPQSAAAQRKAMDIARTAGIPISCDVNFRPNLWPDPRDMLDAGRILIAQSSIVKVSEDELFVLNAKASMDEAVGGLWHDGLQMFSVTRGAKGAVLYALHGKYVCEGFSVNAVDTTGAGDAYAASLLSGVLDGVTDDLLPQLVLSACAAGALATTKKGAMESQPNADDIARLIGQQKVAVRFQPRS